MRLIINNIDIIDNTNYSKYIFNNIEPKIYTNIKPAKLYTILMFDINAPNPSYVHWLVINNNTTIINYMPPSPPSGSHNYFIYILEQSSSINYNYNERTNFDQNKFISLYKLKLFDSIHFIVS